MSTFMQYAMLAASEALDDAAWRPETDQQREMTVSRDSSRVPKIQDGPAELKIRAFV